MREFHGKASVAVRMLYAAFALWSLYGAVVPVET